MNLTSEIKAASKIAIAGHIRPDGDCVGSCMGMYHYIKTNYPEKQVTVYMEPIANCFLFLEDTQEIVSSADEAIVYDLFIALDAGDTGRLGAFVKYLETAKRSICIDHHISNKGYTDDAIIVPAASSASELVYLAMEKEKIDKITAQFLYMGIVHDSGMFQYTATSAQTMRIAAEMMEKGIDFTEIVERTYVNKTYLQRQILGRALLESMVLMDGRCIVSAIKMKDMKFYGVTPKDCDGIVSVLKNTTGVDVAIFIYESGIQEYKVSLRSGDTVNVNEIASYFGGGGHKKAAGCVMQGSIHDVLNNLTEHIERQLKQE